MDRKIFQINEAQAVGLYYAAKSGKQELIEHALAWIEGKQGPPPFAEQFSNACKSLRDDPSLSQLIENAKGWWSKATPQQRNDMIAAQRESWAKQDLD